MQEVKIAIYMRVSTQRQANSKLGLEAQERGIKNWINSKYPKENFEVSVEYFVDDGITGSKFDRKALQQMLSKIEKKIFNVCLIYKVDRLARDVEISSKIAKIVKKANCELYSTSEAFDLNTTEGTFIYNMQSIFGEHERMLIAKRTEDSQISRLKKGEYPFRSPFGYKRDTLTKKLILIKSEAEIIKFIFNTYLKMHNIRETRREIKNIFDLNVSDLFVENILNKFLYTGNYIKKEIEYENIAPQIITKKLFEQVQKQLSHSYKLKREVQYLFHDNIFCFRCNCKSKRTSSYKKKTIRYYYYYCEQCKQSFNVNKIARIVLSEIKYEITKNLNDDKLKCYKRAIKSYEKRRKEINDDYIEERINFLHYKSLISQIEERILDIKDKMVSSTAIDYENMSYQQKFHFFSEHIEKIEIDFKFKTIIKIVLRKKQ